MKKYTTPIILIVLLLLNLNLFGQKNQKPITADSTLTDSLNVDSLNVVALTEYSKKIAEIEQQRIADSAKKVALELQLNSLKTTDNLQKEELLQQLKAIEDNEQARIGNKKARIDSLRATAKAYSVMGLLNDSLFSIYAKIGASTAKERATNITSKIKKLYEDDFFKRDSISVVPSENTYDIVYGEMIIMSVSETDAIWYDKNMQEVAEEFRSVIEDAIIHAQEENSLSKLLLRIGLTLLVLAIAFVAVWLINKGYLRLQILLEINKDKWLKKLSYKDYTFLTEEQEMKIILLALKGFRWFVYLLLLYITLPIIFSIFPFSRAWADTLFYLVWSPLKALLLSIWHYLPNLFSILVIYFVMKYISRFVKYIFSEIESENLKLAGFHHDWAMPTYSIVRFLIYAFMFVLIFPYLPGSDSNIFKGVSVFIGVLFSLGSSSAIANMVAGLVITYMRPFQIGDRIKIADITGDVIEKTLLVTRVRTPKNEIVTIPNSSVLSGNTTNYSSNASEQGLIIHTTVTIGYDVPWPKMHKVLIEAALRTDMVLKEPQPFVLQTSLEDFYVAYQINAYTHEPSKQASIYSNLHQNIQDVCNENGVEILSPHYRAARDGNMITIPAHYLPEDYQMPGFKINIDKNNDQ